MEKPAIEEVQEFFLKVSESGWASGSIKTTENENLPGFKILNFSQDSGELKFRDEYCVGADGLSSGRTVVWFNDIPIWAKAFQGRYPEEFIAPLKRALVSAFKDRSFIGGRGPEQFLDEESNSLYLNQVKGDFRKFRGIETIHPNWGDKGMPEVFETNPKAYHEYHGLWLLD